MTLPRCGRRVGKALFGCLHTLILGCILVVVFVRTFISEMGVGNVQEAMQRNAAASYTLILGILRVFFVSLLVGLWVLLVRRTVD